MFLEIFEQADTYGDENRRKAFSIMRIDDARKFYFQNLKAKQQDLHFLAFETRARFKTEERTRAFLREWDGLTLLSVSRHNSSKALSDCLQFLVTRLSEIQSSPPEEYQNDGIMPDKLFNAVLDVTICSLAYQMPSATLRGVSDDLQSSVASAHATATLLEPAAH